MRASNTRSNGRLPDEAYGSRYKKQVAELIDTACCHDYEGIDILVAWFKAEDRRLAKLHHQETKRRRHRSGK